LEGQKDPEIARLIEAANAGERGAFDALYKDQQRFVLGLARRFTASEADALDILQETFLWFFGRFPGFELHSSLRSFLYPVVKHLAMDLHRKARRVVSLTAQEERGQGRPAAHPSDQLTAQAALETRGDLERRLAPLSEGHQVVLRMRFGEGLRLREIAELLALPVGTVKSRMHHALSQLRDQELKARPGQSASPSSSGAAKQTESQGSSSTDSPKSQ